MLSQSAKIRILSAGAPKEGVRRCAEAHRHVTGDAFQIAFATAPEIERRLQANTPVDLVVAPSRAFRNGPVADATLREPAATLGSIAAGVAIRDGTEAPDLSTADTFRAALLAADVLIYNRASSGAYIETMIGGLGLADALATRTVRTDTGQSALEYLAADRSTRAICFGQATEIKRLESLGLKMAGRLPGRLDKSTEYGAALARTATAPAHRLLAFLKSEHARNILAETGLE